jgi:hypothetical protein
VPSILTQDPRGRLDIALVRAGELLVKRAVEPRVNLPLWDGFGIGEFVEALVTERLGVPSTPLTLVDVARELGILRRVR